jgi:VWFA-related protein
VQVTTRNGQPTENLRPDQFEVNIDGKVRPVVSLDFVRYGTTASPVPGAASAPAPPASSQGATPGDTARVLIFAVDQSSFMQASRQAPVEIIKRIAAMADPRDLIGLIAFPGPGVMYSPSTDRAALLEAAAKIDGRLQLPRNNRVVLSVADAVDWTSDREYRQRIIQRECPNPGDLMCPKEVELMANEMVGAFQMQAMMSVSGLQNAVETVRQYPGRKTLIVVSAGFAATDRMGGKPDITFEADMIGKRAAQANAVIYSLHTDVSFLHAFSSPTAAKELQNVFRDSSMLARGLEQFTGSAGGTVIPVHASPDAALKRMLSETSAYYLLGVEPLPDHRDGQVHRISVKVKQGGTQVRARSSVLIPKS